MHQAQPAGEAAQALGIPDQLKQLYHQQLAAAYAETGNEAKAMELTKSFIDQYGGDSTQLAYIARKALDEKKFDDAALAEQEQPHDGGEHRLDPAEPGVGLPPADAQRRPPRATGPPRRWMPSIRGL